MQIGTKATALRLDPETGATVLELGCEVVGFPGGLRTGSSW